MADRPGVRRIRADRGADPPPADVWPMTVPAVGQLWAQGLELGSGATVLVGENASGTSTVVEVLAVALGTDPEGGSAGAQLVGGQLRLVAELLQLVDQGAQLVVASHSPLVAALPGARILEIGPWGLRPAQWDELELTANWRPFIDRPEGLLRNLG